MSIKIVGPWSAWDARARRAQLVREDGSTAEVLLHPGVGGSLPPLEQARAEGRLIGAARHPAALHLKQVTVVGSAPMWVFDGFSGASLARIARELGLRGGSLPLRMLVEVGVAVVDAMGELGGQGADGRQVVHPGPTPGVVLLGKDGQLKVAGFRAPQVGAAVEAPPGYGAPEGGHAAPAQVYAVGALLVELLTGEAPPAASTDPEKHEAVVRRSLIRVVSRPGSRAPEPLVELLRESLAYAPHGRPSLPRLSVRLSRVARDLPAPDLLTWARDALPALWPRLVGADEGDSPPVRAPMLVGVGLAPSPELSPSLELDPGLAEPTEAASRRRSLPPDAATESVGRAAARAAELVGDHDTEEMERTRLLHEARPSPAAPARPPVAPPPAAPAGGAIPTGEEGEGAPSGRPRARTRSAREEALIQAVPASGEAVEPTVVATPRAGGAAAGLTPTGPGPALVVGTVDLGPTPGPDPDWPARRKAGPGWLLAAVGALLVVGGGAWWFLRGSGQPAAPPDPAPATVPAELDAALGAPGPALVEPDVQTAPTASGSASAQPPPLPAGEPDPLTASASPSPAPMGPPAPMTGPSPGATATRPSSPASSGARAREEATERLAAERASADASPSPAIPTDAGASSPVDAAPEPIPVPVPAPAPQAPPYTLRFSSAYEAVTRLEVQCHGGRVGSGAVVTFTDAVPGPCKVQGTTVDGGRLVALVSVSADGSWRCFERGERACR